MSSAFLERVQASVGPEALARMLHFADRVESILEREADSAVDLVRSVGRLTLDAGGKRLRPMMTALAAWSLDSDADEARLAELGACLELIHMASLIHDDVVDGAESRRGRPTAALTHGPTASVLSGDVLLAKAMRLLALDGDNAIIRITAESVVQMAEGQVQELSVRHCDSLDVEEHLLILRRKTADFIEACCRVGARAAGADAETESRLGAYGHHIGMAFQLADDVLDYRGDPAKTGKPVGTDFREGCPTLPFLLLCGRISEEELLFMRRKFGGGVTDDEVAMIIGWMEEHGALEDAIQRAERHLVEADLAFAGLPDSPWKTLLASVSSFVVTRDR